jgi:hypothetical protein
MFQKIWHWSAKGRLYVTITLLNLERNGDDLFRTRLSVATIFAEYESPSTMDTAPRLPPEPWVDIGLLGTTTNLRIGQLRDIFFRVDLTRDSIVLSRDLSSPFFTGKV